MGPIRSKDKPNNAEASTSKKTKSSHLKKHPHNQPKATPIPGRQKLKAALRQARRFLAKDNLAADKRVETERKIKALEAELQQAEQAQKERAMAVRYHKVKFFERKKVTRKLTQIKKRIASAEGPEKDKLATELFEQRVNINYILHYPKTKKYISLFPPEARQGDTAPVSQSEIDKTNGEREEIRNWVRESMNKKELPSEPELLLDSGSERPKVASSQYPSKHSSKIAMESSTQVTQSTDDIRDDDFFGNDSEEHEGSEEE